MFNTHPFSTVGFVVGKDTHTELIQQRYIIEVDRYKDLFRVYDAFIERVYFVDRLYSITINRARDEFMEYIKVFSKGVNVDYIRAVLPAVLMYIQKRSGIDLTEEIPIGILVGVGELVNMLYKDRHIQKETLGDYSITYVDLEKYDYFIRGLIEPYKKRVFLIE